MRTEQSAIVREISPDVSPAMVSQMWQLFAPDHEKREPAQTRVLRDLPYGPNIRQRMDVHISSQHRGKRPVLMFFPGGGFVAGNRQVSGTPYYDHIGRWATEHDMVGVTVDYRLAPAHTWPDGAADVAAAVDCVRATIAEHGGDPNLIMIAAHSAGAAHVAGYLAGHGGAVSSAIKGAALFSGLYDLDGAATDPLMSQYFGTDPAAHLERSPREGLAATKVPLLLGYSEFDPPLFHDQLARFLGAHHARHGKLPLTACAIGHNHISEIVSVGLSDDPLGTALATFVAIAIQAMEPVSHAGNHIEISSDIGND